MAKIEVKNVYKIFGSDPSIVLPRVEEGATKEEILEDTGHTVGLDNVSMSVEEVRSPVSHITGEVFRRGIEWKASKEDPDPAQRAKVAEFLSSCNSFGQSLEEVLKQFHFDVNIVDDGFLYLVKEYYGKVVKKSTDLKTNACCTTSKYPEYKKINLEYLKILSKASIIITKSFYC